MAEQVKSVWLSSLASGTPYTRGEMRLRFGPTLPRKQYAYRAAPAHVHSAHSAFQLLKHRIHLHNPPTPSAGLTRVILLVFCFMNTGE